jgi:HlyD family secretion protein
MRTKAILALGLAAILGGGGWSLGGRADADGAMTWDTVGRGEIRETISASGEIQAKTRISIGTTLTGEITGLFVRDGQEVRAGERLVAIYQGRIRQQLAQAEAALDAVRSDSQRLDAARDRARESCARSESLFRQGLIADEAYREAQLACVSAVLSAATARANVAQNRASMAAIQDDLDKTVIRAPIDGWVTALKASRGEMAIPGTSNLPGAVLMDISDLHELNAEIKVNEGEVVRLKPGQAAQVTADSLPGRVFNGRVAEIASASEAAGAAADTYKVKVALDLRAPDSGLLRPGMSVRAVILTAKVDQALRVPLQAVLERDEPPEEAQRKGLLAVGSRWVALVVQDGRARVRGVTTGIANAQFYEVLGGLSAGDVVLTGPVRKLRELADQAPVVLRKRSDSQGQMAAGKGQGQGS